MITLNIFFPYWQSNQNTVFVVSVFQYLQLQIVEKNLQYEEDSDYRIKITMTSQNKFYFHLESIPEVSDCSSNPKVHQEVACWKQH